MKNTRKQKLRMSEDSEKCSTTAAQKQNLRENQNEMRERKDTKIFKGIIAEVSPNWIKNTNQHIKEAE